jgi:gliding motility-associated-like protein
MKNQKTVSRLIVVLSFFLMQLGGFAQIGGFTGLSGGTGISGFTSNNGIKPSGGDDVCKSTPLKTGLACTQYSNDTSTASSTPKPACWTDAVSKDVWFSFIATAQDMTISTDAVIFELFPGTSNNDTELAVYKSNDGTCGNISELPNGCDQDSGINSGVDLSSLLTGGGNTKSLPTRQALVEKTGLIPGETYYVRVQGQGGGKGNFCLSAFDTYTLGSKPCEAQAIHPNKLACDKNNGNAVLNTTSQPPGGAVINTIQPGAYVPLGQNWGSCSPALATQYGTWTTFDGDATGGPITVTNNSGNAVDYTLFSGVCTKPVCINSKPCAIGGNVSFSGITTGTKYYILTTLQGGDTNPVVKTDLCITNTALAKHPETAKNLGGVKDSGGTQQADQCPAFEIVVDQVYKTTTYAADKDGGTGCKYGKNVWFTWKVPSTYPKTNGASAAFFQMWNKNCNTGPGSPGTRLIVGAGLLGDPCSGGTCLEFSSPSQTAAPGSSGDTDIYTDAATNVGWDPSLYGNQYWGMFQSGNDGKGDEVCDFNFMIGSTPSLKGITIDDHTICEGQSIKLTASGGTAYEWSTGETTTSLTVSPTVNSSYTVTATAGADGYAVGYVTVIPYPFTVTATPGAICSSGTSATLTATTTSSSTLTPTYTWTPATNLDKTTGATVKANPTATTTYTVTSTIGAAGSFKGCKVSTPVTVTVGGSIPITVNSGAACPGVGATLTASGGITYTWTPTTNLVPASGVGTSVTASPSSTTTYTVTGENNGCKGVATSTVTISTTPTITVNSEFICAGNTATLTASGASTYVWLTSGGTTTSGATFITPALNATTSYTVTGTSLSGCSAKAVSTVTINSALNVVVSASSGGSFCPNGPAGPGGSTTLTATGASSYTWTPATGLSSTNGASVVATPTVTTTYTVNGEDAGGCKGSDNTTVTVLGLDDATFNYSSAAFCAPNNDNAVLKVPISPGAKFSITPTSAILDINTGALTIITGTPTGHYDIKYTTANQCPNSYTVGIDVVANPSATFSYNLPNYCNNAAINPVLSQPAGSTKGMFTAKPSGLSLNATTGAITLATSTAGTYTVINTIAAGGGCPPAKDSSTITINAVPTVTATTATVCAGTTGTITANGATTYTWAGGFPASTTLSDNPLSTKTYTVTGTANGCSANGTGTIYVDQNPIVGVIPPPAAVCPGKTATLTATGATSYVWVGGPGSILTTLTDAPLLTTTYTVTGTTGICKGTATGVITIGSAPIIGAADATICSGSTGATLTANGGATYKWSTTPIQTTQSINVNPLVTTTYTVTGTGSTAGCDGVAYPTVFVNATPTPTVTVSPATICVGKTSTITATPAGAASYSWSPASTGSTLTVTPLVTTLYTVTVTATSGCFATASGSVVVNPIPATGVNNATICSGQTANLTATGAATYTWLPNIGTKAAVSTPALTTSTSYTVTGTTLGCSKTAISTVTVSTTPTVTVNSVSICAGGTIKLTASGANSYTWLPGGSTTNPISIVANSTITYTVIGKGLGSCTSVAKAGITAYPTPVAAFVNPNVLKLSQASINFIDQSSNANVWLWNFGDNFSSTLKDPQHIYADTGLYVIGLKVISPGGCVDSVLHDIKIIPDLLIYIPNAFTPNGDSLNDGFGFKSSGLTANGFDFSVYDRWGERIFHTTNITTLWKGDDTKGEPCPQDVYVYSILIKDSYGKEKKYIGSINLIR